jgi:beta-1,4-mannooligosaccharide/beta-1,4-mannosyl-N-acetylglucosamine phosphorylase
MKRCRQNPILTRRDVPEIEPALIDVSSVFNPGAVKHDGKYKLMLRVQNRGRETFLLMAESGDGIRFDVTEQVVRFSGIETVPGEICHCYDPRITRIEDSYYVMFAIDIDSGCQLGLGRTEDFESFEFIGVVSTEETRNGVLFPEKIRGKYARLERPNRVDMPGGGATGDTIVLSESEDLLSWRQVQPVISGRPHYWDELIGPGPPPIKTERGWLQIYHGVALHLSSAHIYQAGVMLLDLENPATVIGRSRYNILEPRELYEQVGQVPNVVFPSGAIVEDVDKDGFAQPESKVLVYYGAADTSVCLATSPVRELTEMALA